MNETYIKPILTVFVGVIIVGAIVLLESRKTDSGGTFTGNQDVTILNNNERTEEKEDKFERAKEISTPDGFINTESVAVSELVGKKIILVDFWTYSCINCQRTLPYLNAWHEKYSDDGLVILGVHTPEFEFEQDFTNVQRAVQKYGVEYPVILDNDFSTWRSYKNRYWPRKYLIDIDGFIVYDHIGEGGYEETERKIVELLNERSQVLGESAVALDEREVEGVNVVDFSRVQSPEMYLGSGRLEYLNNLPSPGCFGRECEFAVPSNIPRNTFSLDGKWHIEKEKSVLVGGQGSIFLTFSANKVNLVAGAPQPVRAEIYLDGKRAGSFSGSDVRNGEVIFGAEDLYNLIDLQGNYGSHMLEIRFLEGDISAFAFTFG